MMYTFGHDLPDDAIAVDAEGTVWAYVGTGWSYIADTTAYSWDVHTYPPNRYGPFIVLDAAAAAVIRNQLPTGKPVEMNAGAQQ